MDPELALHGDRDDLLTFTAAPISRQLTQPYSRSMTDEAPPPRAVLSWRLRLACGRHTWIGTGLSNCCEWRPVMAG